MSPVVNRACQASRSAAGQSSTRKLTRRRRLGLRQGSGRTGERAILRPPVQALPTPARWQSLVGREFLLDQGGVVTSGPPGIEPGIEVDGGRQIALPEELSHRLVGARISVKDDLGGEMPELVGGHLDAEMAPDRALDQPGDGG